MSDIPLLAEHFLQTISESEGQAKRFNSAALQQLNAYDWPGNVRELRNAVQRAYVMAQDDTVDEAWLPHPIPDPCDEIPLAHTAEAAEAAPETTSSETTSKSLKVPIGLSMAQAERLLIQATLKQCHYQKERTAAVLGISLKTLYNRLKDYSNRPNSKPGRDPS